MIAELGMLVVVVWELDSASVLKARTEQAWEC